MHSKLAGHLPLQDLIQSTLMSAKTKLAAAEENEKKKAPPFAKKEEKGESKKEEKKEHEEGKEKMSSALDPSDPSDIEKLAAALDAVGDDFLKEADSIENGGESHQGGEQLPTNTPLSGKQPYKKDGSKKHQIPVSTGLEKKVETGPAATAVPDTQHKPPVPLKAAYPAKGVLKTAAERLQAAVEKQAEAKKTAAPYGEAEKEEHKRIARGAGRAGGALGALYGGAAGASHGSSALERVGKGLAGAAIGGGVMGAGSYAGMRASNRISRAVGGEGKKKESEAQVPAGTNAVDFILGKIAESSQGGMTLDSPAGVGPKPASDSAGGNDARKVLENVKSVIDMKKVDGKKPQKRMLSEVLTEPAQTKSTDSKVQENLRNASAGGVKIAAARAYLAKVAADENDPKHEALKKALAKKSEEKGESKEEKSEEKKES